MAAARLTSWLRKALEKAVALEYDSPPSWAVLAAGLNQCGSSTINGRPWTANNLFGAARAAKFDRDQEWAAIYTPPKERPWGGPAKANQEAQLLLEPPKPEEPPFGMSASDPRWWDRGAQPQTNLPQRPLTLEEAWRLPGAEKPDSLANRMERALAENNPDSPDAAPAQRDMIAMGEQTPDDQAEENTNGR